MTEEELKSYVWIKGKIITGYDPAVWRRDDFGNNILFSAYGDRDSEYGWEIDHIIPVCREAATCSATSDPFTGSPTSGVIDKEILRGPADTIVESILSGLPPTHTAFTASPRLNRVS